MSTENLKANQIENTINQSDIGHYIEKSLDNFSNANTDKGYWKLYNKNNPDDDGDQVKTVFGISRHVFTAKVQGINSRQMFKAKVRGTCSQQMFMAYVNGKMFRQKVEALTTLPDKVFGRYG